MRIEQLVRRFACVVLFALPVLDAAPASKGRRLVDVNTVKLRIYKDLLSKGGTKAVSSTKLKEADGFIATLESDGNWADINLNPNRHNAWQSIYHLVRVHKLARVYRTPGHRLYGDDKLKQTILSALDFWFAKGQVPGWWWQQIGEPREMGRILTLMEEALSPKQWAQGLRILTQAKMGMTGQNMIWLADVNAVRGCLEKNPHLVEKAFNAIAETIRVSHGDGIQIDYSFHQHGFCLYSGGYGADFSIDCPRSAMLVRGTSFAFTKDKIDILSRYILDGQQWMLKGETWDFGVVGREISRKGQGHKARSLIASCRNMAALGTSRQKEFETFAVRIEKGATSEASNLVGNKYFWRSAFMAHHRKNWYASARMYSKHVSNTDTPHHEQGRISHHIADGVTCILRDGNEYFNIYGAWDWRKIPGATIQQKKLKGNPRRERAQGPAFAGGVSDSNYGLAAFDFRWDGLSARKAWFFFDDEFVCLGAGISCSTKAPVLTTLNQCHLRGEAAVFNDGKERVLESGTHPIKEAGWIHHDKVGYLFPEPCGVTLRNVPQKNAWRRINKRYSGDKEGVLDVFSVWLDHGTTPKNASYAYVVIPGIERKHMASYAKKLPITILSNTREQQAVSHPVLKITGMAFYKPGTIKMDGNLHITVTKPCLILARDQGKELILAVSDPSQIYNQLIVKINRKLQGEGCVWKQKSGVTSVTFKLPSGHKRIHAGKSIIRKLVNMEQL